jgi:DNA-binding response OmpR family regulator
MARVLIVDDEASLAEVLGLFLRDCGHRVRIALTAKRALRTSGVFRPDLLIVDYCLHDDMDGAELARGMRASNPELHVILITGMLVDEVRDAVADIPRLRLLGKPLELGDIELLVNELTSAAPSRRRRQANGGAARSSGAPR